MSIAIIGAGPAGLTATKAALECGLQPTTFEKSAQIGGLWTPQVGSVWESMRTNISHHTCSFSDFPWPVQTEDFPTNLHVHKYLCSYANHFGLNPFVSLKTDVQKVSPLEDKWKVEWVCNGKKEAKIFDHVLVCTGIFSKPYIPPIPGLKEFKGPVIHSKDYKNPKTFVDKKVAVIGNAFSGCEIAAEIAGVAKKVIHVANQALWILPRYLKGAHKDLPLDLLFYTRKSQALSQEVPPEKGNPPKHEWFRATTKQEEISPALKVESDPTSPPFVAISDSYLSEVTKKRIEIKKGPFERVENDRIICKNGVSEKVDAIVLCTGYQTDLPFFDSTSLEALGFNPQDQLQPLLLHKTVFPPNLQNLAFIGLYRGPFFGVMELQARFACMVFSKRVRKPTQEEIEKGVREAKAIRENKPRPQFPRGDYVAFADELASEINVLPDFEKIKKENPELYQKLWEGPLTPASYRLAGFKSSPTQALEMIDRVFTASTKGK